MSTHARARYSDSLTLAFTFALTLALVLFAVSGCQTKNDRHANAQPGSDGNALTNDGTTPNPGQGIDAYPAGFDPSKLQIVYFDYDSAILRDDARESLKANAGSLKKLAQLRLQIAGHCDERGTQSYNLALGERRAQAVRDYLAQLGVPADRLITISYGKEKPADAGNDEAAWAKNRRCEFNKNL